VPSQQPKGQLQTQHSVETGNYIINKHNIKKDTDKLQASTGGWGNNNNNNNNNNT
jgi:hypothetical protein